MDHPRATNQGAPLVARAAVSRSAMGIPPKEEGYRELHVVQIKDVLRL
jgi:hypothetical protein